MAERQAWDLAQQTGEYEAPSLEREGFIHCSTPWQVVRIANLNFPDRDDLLLLVIDPSKLSADVVFENCEGRIEPFPHIYGTVPLDAVETVWPLVWHESSYHFPEGYRADLIERPEPSVARATFTPRSVPLRQGRSANLRTLGAGDVDAFLELQHAVVRDGRGIPQSPGESFGSPERLTTAWERGAGRDLFIGAWVDGAMAGEGNLRREPLERVAHVAELGVSIHPQFQGIGLGRAITEAMLGWAREHASPPLHRIELRVFASNQRAINLYESLGFVHEGRRRDYLRSGDGPGYEDDLIMGLLAASRRARRAAVRATWSRPGRYIVSG